MTSSEATSAVVALVPDRTVICSETYQSTVHGDFRGESISFTISVLPAITSQEPCQNFYGKSFRECVENIERAL